MLTPIAGFALFANGGIITSSAPLTLTTGGDGSNAAQAQSGGSITLSGGASINATGAATAGLAATGLGSNMSASNVMVTTTGFSQSSALVATVGSTATIQNFTFITAGSGAGANNNYGASASFGAAIVLENGTIQTSSEWGHGLFAGNSNLNGTFVGPGQLTATNVEIVTTGTSAHAVMTNDFGQLTISGGSVSTQGPAASGIMAYATGSFGSGPSKVVASNTSITTTGQSARGVTVLEGSEVDLHNVTVHTMGIDANALRSFSFGTNAPSTILVDGGSVTANQATAIEVSGTTAAIKLQNGVVVSSGLNRLMDVLDQGGTAGQATLLADRATLNGDIFVQAPSIADVTLANNTVLTGAVEGVRQMNVVSSRWNVTGNSTIVGTLTNAGTIQFTSPFTASSSRSDPVVSLQLPFNPVLAEPTGAEGNVPGTVLASSGFKTLTTTNYVGAGGTLGLNVFLGGDNSPSDKLIINGGTATGSSFIHITNAGGPGTETTGNGILVVDAINGATTAPGAFALLGEARAGAYDYRLFQGGLGGGDPNDWFLRSTFIVGPPPLPGEPEPEPFPPGVLPPAPPIGPLPPGIYPIIGPELATYGAVQPIARELGFASVGTLHERFGDSLEGTCAVAAVTTCCQTPSGAAAAQTAVVQSGGCRPAVWARAFGQSVDNRYQAFADPQATGQILGFQSGFDLWRGSLIAGHTDTAGVYVAYGNAHVDVNGLVTNAAATAYVMTRTGAVNLNAWSGGAYWTHYGPGGWYVDAVIQGTGYSGGASTTFANLPINGSGVVTSLEAGYPIPLPWFGPRFVLEPQGQIIWQEVSFSDANDGLGSVGLGSTLGTTGRLGLRGKWTFTGAYGVVWQPYVQANLWRDWGGEATTMFGIDHVPLIEQATRLEFAGGVTVKLGARLSAFAQGGYQFATDESGPNPFRRDSAKGDIGFRYAW